MKGFLDLPASIMLDWSVPDAVEKPVPVRRTGIFLLLMRRRIIAIMAAVADKHRRMNAMKENSGRALGNRPAIVLYIASGMAKSRWRYKCSSAGFLGELISRNASIAATTWSTDRSVIMKMRCCRTAATAVLSPADCCPLTRRGSWRLVSQRHECRGIVLARLISPYIIVPGKTPEIQCITVPGNKRSVARCKFRQLFQLAKDWGQKGKRSAPDILIIKCWMPFVWHRVSGTIAKNGASPIKIKKVICIADVLSSWTAAFMINIYALL